MDTCEPKEVPQKDKREITMSMKKILLGKGAVAAGSVLALVFMAGMQTMSVMADSGNGNSMMKGMQNVLQVGSTGKATLRGTIVSTGGNSLMVKSWGGNWTVNVNTPTEILPAAFGRDLTQFKAGDFVGVQGMVSQTASLTIDATVVRDRTAEQMMSQQQQQNTQTERDMMKNKGPMNFQGMESNLNGSTFMLTASGGVVYTVNVAPGAQVTNRAQLTIPLSSIRNGDTVRVWGTNASGTITAQIVRDLSLGMASSTNRSGSN
jgi:Domain of unknown function (DUF5666)